MIRPSGFRLHPCINSKAQEGPRSTTHVVAPHEGLDPGLIDLFLHHVDVQRCRLGVCGHGEGEFEELPSRVSFRVRFRRREGQG